MSDEQFASSFSCATLWWLLLDKMDNTNKNLNLRNKYNIRKIFNKQNNQPISQTYLKTHKTVSFFSDVFCCILFCS